MTSIYDDISYIERLNDMNTNQDINDNEERNVQIIINTHECERDIIKIIDLIYQKNMFEKLLQETLQELNQTNPCLETGKYHMLCLYSNRYNDFIDNIKYKILTYELKKLSREKKNKRLDWPWYWSWNSKFMVFMKRNETETIDHENYMNNKKRD